MPEHPTLQELESAIDHIQSSPTDKGRLEMISARPSVGERTLLEFGELHQQSGLVGDNWEERGSRSTDDGESDPEEQITIINTRLIDTLARSRSRWQLAGDQLFIDIDLSHDNLPPGTQIRIGSAIIELTAKPHTGCAKFASRFGHDALRFVSGPEAMQQRRRGANAKVVQSGTIRVGDTVTKLNP